LTETTQLAVSSIEQLAACAAKHRMLLDFTGSKPFGHSARLPQHPQCGRGKGLENCKWEPIVNGVPLNDFPRYDVTIPYLRQLIGPMDYTPGAMVNATRGAFRAVNELPMSQGTRVHQMAMYTVFEAPLQMLADSPSRYLKEPESTDFIAKVPTVFDETIALDGKIAEYITIARRRGDTWFVGSLTNWTPRACTINLSFLGEGNYEAEIFSDGINADRDATDYQKELRTVTAKDKLQVQMAPGGGWTARITKK
jgi:alpha-glucosidase